MSDVESTCDSEQDDVLQKSYSTSSKHRAVDVKPKKKKSNNTAKKKTQKKKNIIQNDSFRDSTVEEEEEEEEQEEEEQPKKEIRDSEDEDEIPQSLTTMLGNNLCLKSGFSQSNIYPPKTNDKSRNITKKPQKTVKTPRLAIENSEEEEDEENEDLFDTRDGEDLFIDPSDPIVSVLAQNTSVETLVDGLSKITASINNIKDKIAKSLGRVTLLTGVLSMCDATDKEHVRVVKKYVTGLEKNIKILKSIQIKKTVYKNSDK